MVDIQTQDKKEYIPYHIFLWESIDLLPDLLHMNLLVMDLLHHHLP